MKTPQRQDFWFCKRSACAHGGCADPLFCTQMEHALNELFRRVKNEARAVAKKFEEGKES